MEPIAHFSETKVVNFRLEPCDVKITRSPKGVITEAPNKWCFCNPYHIATYGREKCIELFKEYFLKKVTEDLMFRQAVLSLKGKRLGCFCKDLGGGGKACHGDVIKEWLDDPNNV